MPEDISGQTPWRRSRLVLRPAAPAAGADWSLTVPAGHQYRVLSVAGLFTASAAVASRVPNLVVGDGHGTYLGLPPAAAVTAGKAETVAWFEAAAALDPGSFATAPMPYIVLEAGWTIGSSTDLIDAGDQWSGIAISVVDTMVIGGPVDINTVPELIVALL